MRNVLLLNEVIEMLNNGGGSINYRGRDAQLKSGYMVSLEGSEIIIPVEQVRDIQKAINKHFTKYACRGNYIGIWVNNGDVYIDVSKRIATKRNAVEMGLNENQLAIYNNFKGVVITL